MCMKNGKTVWIEVKIKGWKPRKLQLYRINELNLNGFQAFWTLESTQYSQKHKM